MQQTDTRFNDDVQHRIENLTKELTELRSLIQPRHATTEVLSRPQPPDRKRVSRAGLFRTGAAGLAGVTAASLLGNSPATALASSDTNFVAQSGSGTAFSTNSNGYQIGADFHGINGVHGESRDADGNLSFGNGVEGYADSGCGVLGSAQAGGTGVVGGAGVNTVLPSSSDSAGVGVIGATYHAVGVLGESRGYQGLSSGTGVKGVSGSGTGVNGVSTSGVGVMGKSSGVTSYGVHAINDGPGGTAVFAEGHTGTGVFGIGATFGVIGVSDVGTAVEGQSTKGRGAVFAGKLAQLQLIPSKAATHPTAGVAGDIFLDSAHRLWLCTVTGSPATWRQVKLI